jgi:cytochrome c oxidase subunit II
VGLYGTHHSPQSRFLYRSRRRILVAAAVSAAVFLLSGCSAELTEQAKRFGLPERSSVEGEFVGDLWQGFWITAAVVGVTVWGLILWCVIAYRRRTPDLPNQTRYNLPIETLYTVTPLLVVAALFTWTIRQQNEILELSREPDVTIGVVGQQWSWTFNYADEGVYDVGTAAENPTLYLPVDNLVRFELRSPDVIHSFWIPSFYFKMDVIPGRLNEFQMTPDTEGTFKGKCAELCGTYHSRMLFNVRIVSEAEYRAHIAELRARGQTGTVEAPLRGAYRPEPLTEQTGENAR